MRIIAVILILVVAVSMLEAQTIDTVVVLVPGRGQNIGQSPAFFPANIFGVPDARASESQPTTDPREVCSLGLGGSITVGFTQHVIVDRPGPDFVVFENAFTYGDGRTFAEPARVEVSSDGITWTLFPFDSLTLEGCAGKTPTSGEAPYDPARSGGDAFDLSSIGADSIRYIRLTDVTDIILTNSKHPYYDPSLSGFDLDAITTPHGVREARQPALTILPRSTTVEIAVSRGIGLFEVFDVGGRLLRSEHLPAGVHLRALDEEVPSCSLVRLQADGVTRTAKVLR